MDWIIKSDEIPGPYGKYPGARSVEELISNGVIVLDKWQGPTSHDVTATIKKILNLNKTGHAGTLDPMVSGVLLVTLDNACKVIPALQKLDKEYIGIMHMHKEVDYEKIKAVISKFLGNIEQLPPVRSAVARKIRRRTIHSIDILDIKNKDILLNIKCEAGTYIRKLIDDIGKQIGGAHMSELRRIKAGRFDEKMAVRAQDLLDAYIFWKENGDETIKDFILPVEASIEHLKKIIVKDSAVYAVSSGSPLYTGGISKIQKYIKIGEMVALLTLKGELIALANATMTTDEMMKTKGLAAKTDRVIMQAGIYPKMR